LYFFRFVDRSIGQPEVEGIVCAVNLLSHRQFAA
jgi:hypothetical protein